MPAMPLRQGLAGAGGLASICTVPSAGFRHSRNALPLVPDAVAVVVRGNVVGGRPETGSQPAGIAETAGLGQLPNRRDSAAEAALKPWGGPAGTGAYPASWWRPRRGASYRWWLGTHQHATLAMIWTTSWTNPASISTAARRRSRGLLFYRLAQPAAANEPVPYKAIVGGRSNGPQRQDPTAAPPQDQVGA